jgi:hypothetical protein
VWEKISEGTGIEEEKISRILYEMYFVLGLKREDCRC